MNKFKHSLWDKKLPSFLGSILMILSLSLVSWLSSNAILFGTKAAVGNIPKNVRISNISDSSFTLSYTTDDHVLGTLAYGKDKSLGAVAIDDRDQFTGKPLAHRVHHITIQRLNPSTTYYVSIVSGDRTFLNNNTPYQVTTAPPALDKPTAQAPLAGKVTLDDGSIPTEAIAYVQTKSSQLLSALLKPDGSYLIPLNSMRQYDFSSYVMFTPNTGLDIEIISPTLKSHLSTIAEQANPVPAIVLSKNYDFSLNPEYKAFSGGDASTASDSASTASESAAPELPQEEDQTIVTSPQITVPSADQEFKDQQPRFSGKAIPDSDVEIIISSSNEIRVTVKSDQYGNWSYRPSTPLTPGNQTLTINSVDSDGMMQTVTQSFTVFASGSEFIEPSVLPPTQAPKPTAPPPTATPTIIPTQVPTATPTPTKVVTPTTNTNGNGSSTDGNTNLTPAPTRPPIPRSGNEIVPIGIFASVISLILGGILFILL